MRSPTSKPDLQGIVNALIKKINEINKNSDLLEPLKKLTEKYVWDLLNNGTHEQENLPEFDANDVKNLIDLIKTIEELVNSLKINTTLNKTITV